uniref:Uncharacterized protein AlNc14C6G817 n=1 Tax=Albugo laibachii Nc14 TaxID=890382 RepID=F0W138_9STRA|nr:conserved hypothetical protein [Albugo laibachii Nc14]|eukprot:CCA14762.1 conserved hypothetical protein [Albugo laibachii Nc14]
MTQIGIRNGQLLMIKVAKPDGVQRRLETISNKDFANSLIPLGHRLLEAARVHRENAFILITDEDSTSCGILAAAVRKQCVMIVIDKSRIEFVDCVVQETGIHSVFVVDHENECIQKYSHAGDLIQADEDAWFHQEPLKSSGGIGFLTSGSFGHPKIVIHSWDSVKKQAESSRELLLSQFDSNFQLIFCTSIAHAFSFNALCMFLAHIDYLEHHPSPFSSDLVLVAGDFDTLLRLISKTASNHPRKHRVLFGTPGTYTMLLEITKGKLPLDVDIPFCAGALLDPRLYRRVSKVFQFRLIQNYGSTETGIIACWEAVTASKNAEQEEELYLTSACDQEGKVYVGVPFPGVQIEIDQSTGEILTQTPYSCIGYARNKRLDKFQSQMYRTGDRSMVETIHSSSLPRIFLFGRIRSKIQVGDSTHQSFYEPAQLENIVCKHSSVTDALVLGPKGQSRAGILVRVVLDVTCDMGVAALKVSLVRWLEANDVHLPESSLHVEVVETLGCSPAGKLIYR